MAPSTLQCGAAAMVAGAVAVYAIFVPTLMLYLSLRRPKRKDEPNPVEDWGVEASASPRTKTIVMMTNRYVRMNE